MSCFLATNFGEYTRNKANGSKIQQDVQTFWETFKLFEGRSNVLKS